MRPGLGMECVKIALAVSVGLFTGMAPAHAQNTGFCGLVGRVRVVDSPAVADYRVRLVPEYRAQLRVRWVDGAPMRAGEWQRVINFADFTVYFVESDGRADFSAGSTRGTPGCP